MMTRYFALVLLFLICGPALAAEPASEVLAGEEASVIWQASQSYEGGAQADPRLDQPVQFWRPGVPLQEVLAELTRQTGVRFAFRDPGRDEPRLCVTLYLNPKEPPSLRAVMVQLAWVMNCSFAYTEPEVGSKTYYLLWSSLGEGAAQRIAAAREAQRAEFRSLRQEQQAVRQRTAAERWAEAKVALALSQDEAVARYRGADDAMLLNLLDPSRRAALSFLATLPEGVVLGLFGEDPGPISLEWSSLSADQQAALRQALGEPRPWPADGTLSISINGGRGGRGGRGGGGGGAFSVSIQTEEGRQRLGNLPGLFSQGDLRGREAEQLQRLLGEAATPQQREAARAQREEQREAERAAWQQEFAQRRAEAEAATRTLSPEREAQLAALTLEANASALWQLQEAVAKASGMNVVADCFWPPRGGFGGPLGRPGGGGPALAGSALDQLSRACLGMGGGFGPGPGLGGLGGGLDLGTEWSDAGSFLRFRARSPEIWRAALLPGEVLTQLDTWLEPSLAAESTSSGAGTSPLGRDLEKLSWLAGRLDELQVGLGGGIPYEDPSDSLAARRQALRRSTLQQVARQMPLLRVTATFTPSQWEQVRGEGLRWSDLTPDQKASAAQMVAGRRVPEERLEEVVLQLGETEARTFQPRGGAEMTIPSAPALKVVLEGEVVEQIPFGGGGGPGPGGGRRGGRGGGRGEGTAG